MIQGTAIEGATFVADYYLEVQSQLDATGSVDDPVPAWPFNANASPY